MFVLRGVHEPMMLLAAWTYSTAGRRRNRCSETCSSRNFARHFARLCAGTAGKGVSSDVDAGRVAREVGPCCTATLLRGYLDHRVELSG